MTQVTVPSDNDDIITSWGISVADHANHFIPLIMSADITKSGSTFSDVTDLTFACTSGKAYNIHLFLTYEAAGTSTGLSVGFNHPGGTARAYVEIHGPTSAATHTDEWLSATNTATGTSTVNSSSTIYGIEWKGRYVCTSTGTFALRYKRNGSSANVTIHQGSGGHVIES